MKVFHASLCLFRCRLDQYCIDTRINNWFFYFSRSRRCLDLLDIKKKDNLHCLSQKQNIRLFLQLQVRLCCYKECSHTLRFMFLIFSYFITTFLQSVWLLIHHEGSKHIDVDYHYISELVQVRIIKLVHVKANIN